MGLKDIKKKARDERKPPKKVSGSSSSREKSPKKKAASQKTSRSTSPKRSGPSPTKRYAERGDLPAEINLNKVKQRNMVNVPQRKVVYDEDEIHLNMLPKFPKGYRRESGVKFVMGMPHRWYPDCGIGGQWFGADGKNEAERITEATLSIQH